MLGAQTRAAEYNAAKKASARQASREAEEQKLPPPAAPISLSAFTRIGQTSRNKGKKDYIPLILEQTPEAPSESGEDTATETPTKAPANSTSEDTSTSGSSSATRPRVILPRHQTNPPTMPRAMVYNTVPGGQPPDTTPRYASRPQHPPNSRYMPMPPPACMQYSPYPWSADHVFTENGHGFPWTGFPLMPPHSYSFDQQNPIFHQSPAPLHNHTPPTSHTAPPAYVPEMHPANPDKSPARRPQTPENVQSRFVFGPDDISPSKQETKIAIRKIAPEVTETNASNTVFSHDSQFERPVLNPIRMSDPASAARTSAIANGSSAPDCAGLDPTARPIINRYDSEATSEASFQPVSLPNPLRRYTDTDCMIDPPVTAIPWREVRASDGTIMRHEERDDNYDRWSKMKKFVAVQEVLSRKGKTVLNNPERKPKPSNSPTDTPVDFDEGPGPSMTEDEARSLPLVKHDVAARTPPGLVKPAKPYEPSPTTFEHERSRSDPTDPDVKLRESFGVAGDEWFDLKVPSVHDRKKMQNAMQHVIRKDAGTLPQLLKDVQPKDGDQAVRWMQTDSRRFQEARQRHDILARAYSARVHGTDGNNATGNGDMDVHAGTIRAAGHMLANLSEYIVDERDEKDYFNPMKAVPENAIDPNSTSLSLFEDKKENVNVSLPRWDSRDGRLSRITKEAAVNRSIAPVIYDKGYAWGA